jgi:hypothetical protein
MTNLPPSVIQLLEPALLVALFEPVHLVRIARRKTNGSSPNSVGEMFFRFRH